MMWAYGYGWPGWGWPAILGMSLWGIFWLALIGLAIWALVHWLNRRSTAHGPATTSGPSAMEILRQRYARGEIDSATFERMREQLESSRTGDDEPVTTGR